MTSINETLLTSNIKLSSNHQDIVQISQEAYETRKIISCLVQGILILVSCAVLLTVTQHPDWGSYIFLCHYGMLIVVVSLISYIAISKQLVTPMMLVMLSFILFQFGIPILYGLGVDYSSWYVSFLTNSSLTSGSAYTILCIQIFIFGASCVQSSYRNLSLHIHEAPFIANKKSVIQASFFGFIVTGLIVIPRAFLFLRESISAGISAARLDYASSSIVNITRGLFIPFGFLLISYLPRSRRRSMVCSFLLIYAFISALAGDRTEGLTLIVCLVMFLYSNQKKRNDTLRSFRIVGLVIVGIALLWLLSVIAQIRVGHSARGMSITDGITSAIGEMGFNSLTIDFQIQHIHWSSHGVSYLASLAELLPSSFDIAGVKQALAPIYAPNVYTSVMESNYVWANNFGQGYSLIAESYYNFGYAGCLAIGIIGAAIQRLLSIHSDSPFGRYCSLVFLWSFLTLPRRDIGWLINACEWNLLIVMLILWLWYSVIVRDHSQLSDSQ